MTDVVFFLKAFASQKIRALPWPRPVKFIGLEPPAAMQCSGVDPFCSTAYGRLWEAYGGRDGRFVETILGKHGVTSPGKVAFVGHSAAHALLNPLLLREGQKIDAVILLDASFGGGKSGYTDYIKRAARGERLFASTTGDTGGDTSLMVPWTEAATQLHEKPVAVEPRGGLPIPKAGAWRLGDLAFVIRYVPGQPGTRHWEQGTILPQLVDGYLVDYWAGRIGGGWRQAAGYLAMGLLTGAALGAVGYYGWRWAEKGRAPWE